MSASRQPHRELGEVTDFAIDLDGAAVLLRYDLGYFDQETCRLEPIENPFGPKVLPMCPE